MRANNLTPPFVLISSTLLLFACAPAELPPPTGHAVRASAPATGKADAADKADTSCQVVLRTVGRKFGGNGYITKCTTGVCNWVWMGEVAVAEGVKPGKVRVLYRLAGDPSWWQVDASKAKYSSPGYVHYAFSMHEHLIGPSATKAELAAATIEMIPFIELSDGTRLFDHNGTAGAFANYVLVEKKGFLRDGGGTCKPVFGTVAFYKNWSEYFSGVLRQDGYLVVQYDLERLPKCRGTHNGYPAWDIVAHVKFGPGGQHVTGSVRQLKSNNGVPINEAERKELRVKIPTDATSVQIWFHNYTGAGSSCQAWDSNLGANYTYDVWPPASHPRCKDVERWTKQNSDMPYASKAYCLGYDVDQDHAATHCELYLEGIGHGYMGHYGIPNRWVEAYIVVGPQQGQVLGAGMYSQYREKTTGQIGQRVTMARKVEPDKWQTGLITLRTGMYGRQGFAYDVEQMAFFVDVRRSSGQVDRLWQSRGGANYTMQDAFTLPTTKKYIAYGNIQYASQASSIFDVKRACGK